MGSKLGDIMLYHIVTYGCQMNVHESEKIANVLEELNYQPTENREDADIIVFNTCAIREGAENRAFGNIGALKQQKKRNKNLIIVVCGCMTQQKDVQEKIFKTFPFVDIVIGTHNLYNLKTLISRKITDRKRIKEYQESGELHEELIAKRTSGDNAWVNIMYGCNNFCTYCIVPYVRGREISRKKSDILNEIKDIVATNSYKTITLLGQNVNSYGNDDKTQGTFSELLQDICNLDGDFKLTFMTSHPKDLSDEVIEVMAKYSKISKSLHLPVQAGSNKTLKAMNRSYTKEAYLNLIEKIREKMPEITLSTDIIVGFPGETDEDYQQTVDLIKQVRYHNAFIFMYSKRKGTIAEKMENQVPIAVKRERIHNLLEIQHEISEQLFKEMIGKTIRVLFDTENTKEYIGKAQCGKVVKIAKEKPLKVGNFYDIDIIDYNKGNLIGRIN